MAPGHPACTALLPRRKLSSAKRTTEEELKGRSERLSAKPVSAEVETKPKKAAERVNLQTKQCVSKGKGK